MAQQTGVTCSPAAGLDQLRPPSRLNARQRRGQVKQHEAAAKRASPQRDTAAEE